MKTRKLSLAIAALLITSAAFVSSCKKHKTEDKDTDTATASDNSMAESSSNDAIKMAGQASESGSLGSYRLGDQNGGILTNSVVITYDSTNKKILVDFGPTPGVMCHDGKTRMGMIKFDYSGSTLGAKFYRHPGFQCVITTPNNDYYVDGNKVTFSKTITNTTPAGFNPATTNLTWSVTGSVTIVKNGGGTINWSCNRTITLMNTNAVTYAGSSIAASYNGTYLPIDWLHALFSVSGSANGTSAAGQSYSFSTTSPLVVNMNCAPIALRPGHHPIVQGSFDFTPSGKATRHVDFGNGSCDNTFTVTINGVSYTITIN